MREVVFDVEGMICGGCESRIETALKNLKEVKKVKADYKKGTVTITLKSELDNEILKDRINVLGFDVIL